MLIPAGLLLAAEGFPIPKIPTPAPTSWVEAKLEFNRTTMQGIFSARVPNPGPAEQRAVELMDLWARAFTGHWSSQPFAARTAAAAGTEGVDDPLVVYLRGISVAGAGRREDALRLYQRAALGMAAAGYPDFRQFRMQGRIAGLVEAVSPEQLEALCQTLRASLLHLSTDPRRRTWEVEGLSDVIDPDGLPNPACHDAIRRVLEDPELPKAATAALLGCEEIEAAWKSRGSGWASGVTDEGWTGFRAHLAKARQLLTAAAEADPQVPFPAMRMLTVCMGESTGTAEMKTWFAKATHAIPDYGPVWRSLAEVLVPRWGGSYEEMRELAKAGLDSGRFDTDLPWFYVEVINAISDDQSSDVGNGPRESTIWQEDGVWDGFVRMFDGYAASTSIPAPRKRWMSLNRGAYAIRCGRTADGRALLRSLALTPAEFAAAANRAGRSAEDLNELLTMPALGQTIP